MAPLKPIRHKFIQGIDDFRNITNFEEVVKFLKNEIIWKKENLNDNSSMEEVYKALFKYTKVHWIQLRMAELDYYSLENSKRDINGMGHNKTCVALATNWTTECIEKKIRYGIIFFHYESKPIK